MTDILRRNLAPITEEAWALIDEQAVRILKGNLSARKVVDVSGPTGWKTAAVNLGSVAPNKDEPVKGVAWGVRQVLPLVEIRVPFKLDMWDLDNAARGGKTPELAEVIRSAQKAAFFEEKAVYGGLDAACIAGVAGKSTHKPIALPTSADAFPGAVEAAVHAVYASGVGGPFHLVLGRAPWCLLSGGDVGGNPIWKRVRDILGGGDIHWSPALDGGVLLSKRGGDFELTIGQDFSIGYSQHGEGKVSLYFTESFTFRVIEPAAAVEIKAKS